MTLELTHVASWRGEPFPCLSVTGNGSNALAESTYTHRQGAFQKNHGPMGETWNVSAIFAPDFNGRGPYAIDLWPYGYMRFIEALREKERGYFDHPFHGRAWAQAGTWSYTPEVGYREAMRVDFTLKESNIDEPTYDLVLGKDAITQLGAENRALQMDADLQSLYPDVPTGAPFSQAFLAYLGLLIKALVYDDIVIAVNIHSQTLTAVITSYPLILDPLGWNISTNIILQRRDATTLAQRYGAEAKRIAIWTNRTTRSAIEIAVLLYNDTSRESQFLALNAITDPLFVPPGRYRVQSDFHPDSGERYE